MRNSTLHLTVFKGPKLGEILACNPGAQIRVSRVIKGNTFTIKDHGISQKHFTIKFSFDISKWTLYHLNTCNGTIINDVNIPSLAPFPRYDGVIIKIGETTSISDKIDDGGNHEAEGGLRRGKRRGARARVVEEDVDDFVEESKNLGKGRTRRGNSSRVSKKDEDLNAIVKDNVVKPRRTGLRKQPVASKKNEALVIEDSIEKPKNVKKGRSRKAPARTQASSAKVPENDKLVLSDSVAEKSVEKGEPNVGSIATHNGSKEKGNGVEEKETRVEEEKGNRVEEEINVEIWGR